MLNISYIIKDFPILSQTINGYPLTYLDNAATTQKPEIVISSLVDYYSNYNSNVHRGVHTLSQLATDRYEKARDKIKDFIHAEKREEIIFTKNDTESLNLVIQKWGEANLKQGDEIILSSLEHHSNIVPWQLVAKKTGSIIKFVHLKDNKFDYEHFNNLISAKTKVVSFSQASNVTGEVLDFSQITDKVHSFGGIVIVDAGQSAPHFLVDLTSELKNVDFVTLSAHKMYGPTGVGILYGKEELLTNMEPLLGGGDMIKEVFEEYSTWNDLPYKFEAGTPNIADVIAFGSAIDYLNSFKKEDVINYENEILSYANQKLSDLEFIQSYSVDSEITVPIVSFNINGVHAHDVGSILDSRGIAIRTGHHCAQPLMKELGQAATARASFALYSSKDDIDRLINALIEVKDIFKV